MPESASRRLLVIRRDNIGDLILTTPLLLALRREMPEAWIGVLTNHYCAPVLAGHPAVDELFVYQKAKHLDPGESRLGAYWSRLAMVLKLRGMNLDDALIPATGNQASAERFARWVAPRRVLRGSEAAGEHEAEKSFALAREYGIAGPPPACLIRADSGDAALARATLPAALRGRPLVGLHLSARRPAQRWPLESFVKVARDLAGEGYGVLLFWSPGAADNPRHPGDDAKAAALLRECAGLAVAPVATQRLEQLITGLDLCDSVICADGGAMHVAAGLGKKIVCLFGDSPAQRWHPWGPSYELLQPPSRQVADIAPAEVLAAHARLPA